MTDERSPAEDRFWDASPGQARTHHDKDNAELEREAWTRPPLLPPAAFAALLVLVLALAGWALVSTRHEVRYAVGGLFGGPLDLGDLRVRHRTEAELAVPAGPAGVHVRLANAIVTYEAGSKEGGFNFFYSPLYRIVVRTKEDFPPKRTGTSFQVEDHLVPFLARHEIEPQDLTSGFAGEGRLYRASDVPEVVRTLLEYYGPGIRAPLDQAWVFLDGETPASCWPFVLLWALCLAAIGLNVRLLVRLVRTP